jgi:hypothetical protein
MYSLLQRYYPFYAREVLKILIALAVSLAIPLSAFLVCLFSMLIKHIQSTFLLQLNTYLLQSFTILVLLFPSNTLPATSTEKN